MATFQDDFTVCVFRRPFFFPFLSLSFFPSILPFSQAVDWGKYAHYLGMFTTLLCVVIGVVGCFITDGNLV